MKIGKDKKRIVRPMVILLVSFIILLVKYYDSEYDFPLVNGDQPTVFYTVTSDNFGKDKPYFTDISGVDKYCKNQFDKLGISIFETSETNHFVEYDINTSIDADKEFHKVIGSNCSEFLKEAPIKSNPLADKKDIKQNEIYVERVGFRVVPSNHVPVIGTLISYVLNSKVGCGLTIAALVLFIILFAFIPLKEDIED